MTLASGRLRISLVLVCALLCLGAPASAQVFTDPGFVRETVVTVDPFTPTGFVFAPDGRIFLWQKPGVILIAKPDAGNPGEYQITGTFADIRAHVNQNSDRGLLGVALDPAFATNGYVYLVYVYENAGDPESQDPRTSRLTRIQADPLDPDVALPGETVLLGTIGTPPCNAQPAGADCIPGDYTSHSIDWVRFGADGKLYLSNGDGATPANANSNGLRAQNLNSYAGKLLRVNPDGTAPGDNPFDDGTNSIRSKVFDYGLRNPFRFTFHPVTGEPFIGDVGSNFYEEIDRGRGKNFGWPCYEGPAPQPAYQAAFPVQCGAGVIPAGAVTLPIFSYNHLVGATMIMGPFYTATHYPEQYRGSLFFADYTAETIRRAVFDDAGNLSSVQDFASAVGAPVHLDLGPDGMLYYIAFPEGELRRIRYVAAGNRAPLAVASATPSSGYSPLHVAFSSSGTSDPDADPLTHVWDLGDGNSSTSPNPSHTYSAAGVQTFTASLTVKDPSNATASANVKITVGSLPPAATIATPADGTVLRPGQTVAYSGSATDPDEGALPPGDLTWQVFLHHNTHVHTETGSTGSGGSFLVEDHDPQSTFSYEIVLTATDASGLTGTQHINLPIAQPDFTITATPPSQTITAGQSAQFSLAVTTVGGGGAYFNIPISFACSGLPGLSACSFSPATITPGTGTASTTLTITTTAPTTAALPQQPGRALPVFALLSVGCGLGAPLAVVLLGRRRGLGLLTILLLTAFVVSCGGGGGASSGGGPHGTPGTARGSYSVTVTASGTGASHPVSVMVTVQ